VLEKIKIPKPTKDKVFAILKANVEPWANDLVQVDFVIDQQCYRYSCIKHISTETAVTGNREIINFYSSEVLLFSDWTDTITVIDKFNLGFNKAAEKLKNVAFTTDSRHAGIVTANNKTSISCLSHPKEILYINVTATLDGYSKNRVIGFLSDEKINIIIERTVEYRKCGFTNDEIVMFLLHDYKIPWKLNDGSLTEFIKQN